MTTENTTTTQQSATAPSTPDPIKDTLVSSILGILTKKEEAKKETAPAQEPKKEEAPAQEAKKEVAPETKKVVVRKKEPKAPEPAKAPVLDEALVANVVERTVNRVLPKAPEPKQEAPVEEDLSYLTSEEQEELGLAQHLESKDPQKKGLSGKLKEFYKKQKEFLSARAAEEGDDYNPETDPAFRKFIAQNDPKFSPADRRRARESKLVEETEQRATERAKADINPKVSKLEAELREVRERPYVTDKVTRFTQDLAAEMPQEIVDHYVANGRDIEKVREAYPIEYDIITDTTEGAKTLAKEYLAIRRGLANFNEENETHKFLGKFVTNQAQVFLQSGNRQALIRNGKQFVPPSQYRHEMAGTHWTFSDDDVLGMLKLAAQTEIKQKIAQENERNNRIWEARQRRVASPSGASAKVSEPEASPRSKAAAPTPVTAETKPSSDVHPVMAILGFGGTKK